MTASVRPHRFLERRRLVAAVVVLQLTVPLVAWGVGVPSKFGFHMYSSRPGLAVTVVDDRARPVSFDLRRWVANNRPEVDWTDALPERVCADLPEADLVTVRSAGRTRTLRCDG